MSKVSTLLDDDQPGNAFSEAQLNERLQQSKLIPWFDTAYETMTTADKSKRFFGGENEAVEAEFSKFTRAALTMNISSFTIQEKSELDWLLYERVPETMAALKSMKRHEYDMFAVAAVQNLNTHLQSLLNGKPKMPVKILPDGTNVKFQPGTLFPIYQSNNSAVTAALKKLGAAWAEANASDLSTEDRYTINAVVETYLPEAWQMVQKLADRPDPIKLKAEMMFLEQVQLMQQQVDAIVDSSTQSALSSIQAYTLFLKGKTAQPKSALSL